MEPPSFEFEESYSGRFLVKSFSAESKKVTDSMKLQLRHLERERLNLPELDPELKDSVWIQHLFTTVFQADKDEENRNVILSAFSGMSQKETCNPSSPLVNAMIVAVVWYWRHINAIPAFHQNTTSSPLTKEEKEVVQNDEEIERVWRSYAMHRNVDCEMFSCWLKYFQSVILAYKL